MSTKTRARTAAPCRGINATGATVPAARYHTQQHASLRADRARPFFRVLTADEREARYQREGIEIARRLRETSVNGLIVPAGWEW